MKQYDNFERKLKLSSGQVVLFTGRNYRISPEDNKYLQGQTSFWDVSLVIGDSTKDCYKIMSYKSRFKRLLGIGIGKQTGLEPWMFALKCLKDLESYSSANVFNDDHVYIVIQGGTDYLERLYERLLVKRGYTYTLIIEASKDSEPIYRLAKTTFKKKGVI